MGEPLCMERRAVPLIFCVAPEPADDTVHSTLEPPGATDVALMSVSKNVFFAAFVAETVRVDHKQHGMELRPCRYDGFLKEKAPSVYEDLRQADPALNVITAFVLEFIARINTFGPSERTRAMRDELHLSIHSSTPGQVFQTVHHTARTAMYLFWANRYACDIFLADGFQPVFTTRTTCSVENCALPEHRRDHALYGSPWSAFIDKTARIFLPMEFTQCNNLHVDLLTRSFDAIRAHTEDGHVIYTDVTLLSLPLTLYILIPASVAPEYQIQAEVIVGPTDVRNKSLYGQYQVTEVLRPGGASFVSGFEPLHQGLAAEVSDWVFPDPRQWDFDVAQRDAPRSNQEDENCALVCQSLALWDTPIDPQMSLFRVGKYGELAKAGWRDSWKAGLVSTPAPIGQHAGDIILTLQRQPSEIELGGAFAEEQVLDETEADAERQAALLELTTAATMLETRAEARRNIPEQDFSVVPVLTEEQKQQVVNDRKSGKQGDDQAMEKEQPALEKLATKLFPVAVGDRRTREELFAEQDDPASWDLTRWRLWYVVAADHQLQGRAAPTGKLDFSSLVTSTFGKAITRRAVRRLLDERWNQELMDRSVHPGMAKFRTRDASRGGRDPYWTEDADDIRRALLAENTEYIEAYDRIAEHTEQYPHSTDSSLAWAWMQYNPAVDLPRSKTAKTVTRTAWELLSCEDNSVRTVLRELLNHDTVKTILANPDLSELEKFTLNCVRGMVAAPALPADHKQQRADLQGAYAAFMAVRAAAGDSVCLDAVAVYRDVLADRLTELRNALVQITLSLIQSDPISSSKAAKPVRRIKPMLQV